MTAISGNAADERASVNAGVLLVVLGGAVIGASAVLARFSETGPIATGAWRMALACLAFLPFYLHTQRIHRLGSVMAGRDPAIQRKDTGPQSVSLDGRLKGGHDSSVTGTSQPGPHPEERPEAASRRATHSMWPTLATLLTGFFFAVDLGFYHSALMYTSVAHATLIANMAPVIAITAGILFFGERMGLAKGVGIVLALGGAIGMTLAKGDLASGTLTGNLLSVAAMLAYSFYMIAIKYARAETDVLSLMTWSAGFGAVVLFVAAAVAGEQIMPQTGAGIAVLVALGVLVHAGGQGLVALGMRAAPLGLASIVLLFQVVVASLLAWAIFGETLNALEALGAVAVLAGIIIATRSR